jgi:hypothetical protein
MSEKDAVEGLRLDELDVALLEHAPQGPVWIAKRLFEGSWKFLFHPKAFPGLRSFRDLAKSGRRLAEAPCVVHKVETEHLAKFLKAMKLPPAGLNRKASIEDWFSVETLVENGEAYAIIPGFVPVRSRKLNSFDVPHAVIPQNVVYAVFQRKLLKIEAFQKAFVIPSIGG